MKPVGGICDTVSIDTMDMKNPFVIYDQKNDMYYMVGDGGYMWISRELRLWTGPYNILDYDTASWVGSTPIITSPEIHKFGNKYYYLATFETVERRSCTTLVSNSITGPYRTIDSGRSLLDESEMAEHPTFCYDEYGVGYMIYNHMGEQNGDGTVQIVRYTDDLGRRMGEAYIMFSASQVPWGRNEEYKALIKSPDIFYSGEEGLGVLFTAYAGDEKTIGVAYSETGTLNGPWVVEEKPLLVGVGGVSMFRDYDGTLVMLAGKDTLIGGVEKTVPKLWKTDSQFEKIEIKGYYKF